MMEIEYNKAKKAYEMYNLLDEYLIEEKILNYILERIKQNKYEIEEMLKMCKRKYGYEDVERQIVQQIQSKTLYKKQVNIRKRSDGFAKGEYLTSIGVVAVEAYELMEVVSYFIKAVKTRNAIIISDVEYEEKDDKHFILLIIKEALKKFGVDENLIQIEPYEECDYEKCDKVIYTYSGDKNIEKNENNKMYVYVENEELEEEGVKEYNIEKESGNNVELIKGNINEVIDKINEYICKGAVIYTKDAKNGYKFVNLVKSKNVFVNSTLQYIEEVEKSKEELLMNKKIMYELKI